MTGKIFRSCFLVGLAVMILCTGLFVAVMASQYEEEVYQQLQEELAYVKHGMEESGQAYLTGLRTTQRLTWVDTDGTVLYDSVADPATMENHGDRAEIRQALEEGSGQGKHLSNTLLQKNLYYAARLSDGTVLRISCVETTVGALILGVLQPVLWILVLALILSGILASRLSRQITKPINSLDLENPRLDETYEELFPLVSRLREQNRTIGRQMDALGRRQREFAALAENMSEGVLLIDSRYHVLSGGEAAAREHPAGDLPAGDLGGRGQSPGRPPCRDPDAGRVPHLRDSGQSGYCQRAGDRRGDSHGGCHRTRGAGEPAAGVLRQCLP